MNNWIKTLIEEKGLDLEYTIEVNGESGLNLMPLQAVVDAICSTCKEEQKAIKNTLVKIDFHNGDIMHYFKHLARAIAI